MLNSSSCRCWQQMLQLSLLAADAPAHKQQPFVKLPGFWAEDPMP
jgi:hypothetical protein